MERGSLVKDLVRVSVASALATCAAFVVAMVMMVEEPAPVRSAAAGGAMIDDGMVGPQLQVYVF